MFASLKKKPGPKPKNKPAPETKRRAKVAPTIPKPKQFKALDSVRIWLHECIPDAVRRPWEILYEDLEEKGEELPADAFKAFKSLPFSRKRPYINVTVQEMAAYVNFIRTVPDSWPEQLHQLGCDEQASWMKEDGHERRDCIEYFREHF